MRISDWSSDVCSSDLGSVAFDTIALFEGHFKDHILANNIQSLSVSFFVPSLRKEYGGCAGNISYNLRLLGADPLPVGSVGPDAADYLQHMRELGIDTQLIRSEEHTSELQSLMRNSYAVFCLKKKKYT